MIWNKNSLIPHKKVESGSLMCFMGSWLYAIAPSAAKSSGGLDRSGGPWEAGGRRRVDPSGVIHEVGGESRAVPHVLVAEISGQLVDNSCHHLHVAQFLSADIGFKMRPAVPCWKWRTGGDYPGTVLSSGRAVSKRALTHRRRW